MCQSMVDIQSATAEIRRGKKKIDRKKKPQDKNIMAPLLHTAAIITATASHHSFFTGQMLFLTPNQQFQSIKGNDPQQDNHSHLPLLASNIIWYWPNCNEH